MRKGATHQRLTTGDSPVKAKFQGRSSENIARPHKGAARNIRRVLSGGFNLGHLALLHLTPKHFAHHAERKEMSVDQWKHA